jgi:hypothetical protein
MLTKYLTELGFTAQPAANGFTRFNYPEPNTYLLMKVEADDVPVREIDLLPTRKFLTEWGLVTDDEFDQFLVESILARYAPRPEPATSQPG